MTLRDETGVIQLISEDIDSFKDITRESTMTVTGVVRHRAEGMTNPNMKTGEVEVLVSSFEVLGEAKSVLPFEINRSTEAFEDTRSTRLHEKNNERDELYRDSNTNFNCIISRRS